MEESGWSHGRTHNQWRAGDASAGIPRRAQAGPVERDLGVRRRLRPQRDPIRPDPRTAGKYDTHPDLNPECL